MARVGRFRPVVTEAEVVTSLTFIHETTNQPMGPIKDFMFFFADRVGEGTVPTIFEVMEGKAAILLWAVVRLVVTLKNLGDAPTITEHEGSFDACARATDMLPAGSEAVDVGGGIVTAIV